MFKPWITIPAEDARVMPSLSIYDRDTRIVFKDVEAIDRTIALLEDLKVLIEATEKAEHLRGE